MMMNRSKLRSEQGFSLLELLLAMSMLAVVTTIGVQSFHGLSTNWNNTKMESDLEDIADIAFSNIEQDIADTLSADLSGVSIIGVDRVSRNKDQFNSADNADDRLIIPVQGTSRIGGALQRTRSVQYHVVRSEGHAKLTRNMGNLGDPNPSSAGMDVIPRADTLRFDVTFATGDAKNPWVNEWKSAEMPRAVRVSMTLADPENIFRQISRKEVYAVHVR